MSTQEGSMCGMGAIVNPRAGRVATLYFDGACRANLGTAGIGFVLRDGNDRVIERFSRFLGYNLTNRVAEYKALIAGLQHALNKGITDIVAYSDSLPLCRHLNGERYHVRDPRVRRYYNTILELQRRFETCRVQHVPLHENNEADDLANRGIDAKTVDDRSDEILRRCQMPEEATEYVLEKRCEGFYQLCFILHIIQHHLPHCYAAVEQQCHQIANELGMNFVHMCKPCLLVQY